MKAAVLNEIPGDLIIEDISIDKPGPGEVLRGQPIRPTRRLRRGDAGPSEWGGQDPRRHALPRRDQRWLRADASGRLQPGRDRIRGVAPKVRRRAMLAVLIGPGRLSGADRPEAELADRRRPGRSPSTPRPTAPLSPTQCRPGGGAGLPPGRSRVRVRSPGCRPPLDPRTKRCLTER